MFIAAMRRYAIYILSCQKKNSNTEKVVVNKSTKKILTQEQKDSIQEAKYYEYDTLLLEKYISDNGHEIQKRGSQSRFLYRISTSSNKGVKRNFDITDNSYVANHSWILWDNEDCIFVRYGCGSPCWGGLVLNLNSKDEMKDYQMYLYEDSINNLVVYPEEGWEYLILENFVTGEKSKEKFEFCERAVSPFNTIDTIINDSPKSVEVKYTIKGCEITKRKTIEIK